VLLAGLLARKLLLCLAWFGELDPRQAVRTGLLQARKLPCPRLMCSEEFEASPQNRGHAVVQPDDDFRLWPEVIAC
jgi:hypothetical protein